jgi:hypothetical protein
LLKDKHLEDYKNENIFLRHNLSKRIVYPFSTRKIEQLEFELQDFGLKSHDVIKEQLHRLQNISTKEFNRERIENHTLE